MKILLLGAKGQLGQSFLEEKSLAMEGTVVAATRDGRLASGVACEQVDLTASQSVNALLERVAPGIIINSAAYNAVDRAEDEPDLAMRVNRDAVAELGTWAASHGARIVHYSSDYVFDGKGSAPYKPGDATHPLGAYGRSKLEGELALAATGADHFIFRTSWVYSPHGSNFLKTMLRLAAEKPSIQVVSDQRGTPTPASLIVAATVRALRGQASKPSSVLEHVVASGSTTWYDFACLIFAQAVETGLIAQAPEVQPIPSSAFASRAKRPQYSVLDNSGFTHRYGLVLDDWKTQVRAVLESLFERDGKVSC